MDAEEFLESEEGNPAASCSIVEQFSSPKCQKLSGVTEESEDPEFDYYDQGVIPPYASAPGWMLPSQLRSTPQQMPAQYITISHPLPYPWQAVPPPNTRHNAKFLRRIQGPVPQRAAVQDEESSSLGESSSVPGSILDESEYTGTGGADIPERSSSYIRATQTRAAGKERPSHPGLPLFNPGNQDYFQALTSLNSHSGASVPSKKTKKAKQNSDSENSNMMHSSEMIQKKMSVKSKAKI
ncbi:uncharacterized protein LOC122791489 [Protopterus annectens]|uniref:uncharacterized protein LOC122791489 n=1 Tax=Protopterus annectens TaxID=7888 RepID=UPI001CFA40DB|nr:uncharacterized protein LOC122791489 [Protopterus annectens]